MYRLNVHKNFHNLNNYIPLIIIFLSCAMLIFVNFYTIKILSASRAYINGESHYSKGQKNALCSLTSYLFTEDEKHWKTFKQELTIPKGDATARIGLIENRSIESIKKGFKAGKNHTDDLDDLIWLFQNFKSLDFFSKAIEEWQTADQLIMQLEQIGDQVHRTVMAHNLNEKERNDFFLKISVVSTKLTTVQDNFSNTIGNGTREIKGYLIYANIFFILLIIGSVSFYYSSMIKKLMLSKEEIEEKRIDLYSIILDLEKIETDLSREIIQQKKIIGTISHDIRSPLKYIVLIGKYLCEETKKGNDEILNKYANSIYKSSSQLYEFTKILVEYSKIYIEDKEIEKVAYGLHDLVNIKKELFSEIAQSNNTKIINKINENLLTHINKRILSIIIHNLLDNAVKNTFDGVIEIDARYSNKTVIFWIKDTGTGMNHDVIEYYTTLFNNEESEKLILRNYGIGLHMVLELLIILKGTIHFSSIINKGTTVTIEINDPRSRNANL